MREYFKFSHKSIICDVIERKKTGAKMKNSTTENFDLHTQHTNDMPLTYCRHLHDLINFDVMAVH